MALICNLPFPLLVRQMIIFGRIPNTSIIIIPRINISSYEANIGHAHIKEEISL